MKRIALFLAIIGLFSGCRKEVLPEAVALNRHTLSLEVGASSVLEATVTPANVTNPALSWSSTQPSVATVDQDGTVTALSEGQAVITVATLSGGKTDACVVTVTKKSDPGPGPGGEVSAVSVTPASAELKEGTTLQLSAQVSPAEASQVVEWASLDTSVATVDETGLVTGVTQGSTKIFARSKADPDKQGSCDVTVIQDPTLKGIAFSATEVKLKVGQTQTLTVIYTPSYASNKKVTWTSGDSSVASVSAEGMITAIAEGSTTVTAKSEEGGFTASCAVTVSKAEGLKIYYTLNGMSGMPLQLNGADDPLNGQYKVKLEDDYYSYRSYSASATYASGGNLYSVEDFGRTDAHYLIKAYLCKNREPLYELPLDYPKDDSVQRMAVNTSGDAAVIVEEYYNLEHYYVILVKADGTIIKSKIAGDFKCMNNPCITWVAGDLYVGGYVTDAYGDNWLSTFKYSEGEWIHTKIAKDWYPHDMEASESGDFYFLASSGGGDTVIYKNGVIETTLTEESNTVGALQLSGGHIFAVVYEVNKKKFIQYCDGTLLRTFTFDNYQTLPKDGIYVSASGDFYMPVHGYIYKNDSPLYSFEESLGFIQNFCVVE